MIEKKYWRCDCSLHSTRHMTETECCICGAKQVVERLLTDQEYYTIIVCEQPEYAVLETIVGENIYDLEASIR